MALEQIERTVMASTLAVEMNLPNFCSLVRRFLHDQTSPDGAPSSSDIPLSTCPSFPTDTKIRVHNSAVAHFHAPSDLSGIGGMRREYIRATPSWRRGPPRYDCIFLNSNPDLEGMRGLDVVRVLLFFSFEYRGKKYPCALVRWYLHIGDEPDEDTGMWVVQPESDGDGQPVVSIIHLDCVVRAAHLIGVYGGDFIPRDLHLHESLDFFPLFYVNKFGDHHAFAIAF
jgi:hypothetical protein